MKVLTRRGALIEETALPASLRGPVDFSHGRQVRISSAWRVKALGLKVPRSILLRAGAFIE